MLILRRFYFKALNYPSYNKGKRKIHGSPGSDKRLFVAAFAVVDVVAVVVVYVAAAGGRFPPPLPRVALGPVAPVKAA